jgi:putative adenylate-forming enzyme
MIRAFLAAKRRRVPERIAVHGAVVTPEDYAARFAEFNVLGLSLQEARAHALAGRELGGYSFGLSTGTMGAPGVFITSAREREAWLGSFLARVFRLNELWGIRVALLLKHDSRLYQNANRGRWLQLRHFDLAVPMDAWAGELKRFAPTVLVGPPSALLALPRALELRPRVVLAGGEVLLPQHRSRLEQRFGVVPRVVYQAKEGFLAVSCERGMMHWNEDLVQLEREPLERGRFVPVLTDLARETQRYVRYRLEDVLREGPCGCGNPLFSFAEVEGRLGDVLVRGDGGRVFAGEVNDWMMQAGCEDYVLEQTGMGEFSLSAGGDADLRALGDWLGGRVVSRPWEFQPLTVKFRPVRRAMALRNAPSGS